MTESLHKDIDKNLIHLLSPSRTQKTVNDQDRQIDAEVGCDTCKESCKTHYPLVFYISKLMLLVFTLL